MPEVQDHYCYHTLALDKSLNLSEPDLEKTHLTSQGTHENLVRMHIKLSTEYLIYSRCSTRSFSKYLLDAYYMPGIILGTGNNQQAKETETKFLLPWSLHL